MGNKIFVTRPSMPELEEYMEEIRPLWESHWLTNMGEEHKKFEEALKQYLDTENLALLVNGHMALEMTLQAMALVGEVITTPFTFVSTTHAIIRNGLKPVFCDINSDDHTMDVSKIESLITEKTSAILPVHVYGNVCNIDAINDIAKRHGLKVIYDAAHAFGEALNGESIAGFGDASVFSFHATKVFHSVEGGAVSFRDQSIGKKLFELKNFGIQDAETVTAVGANAKLNEFCAAMGVCNLRHIEDEIGKRKAVHERYMENLSGLQGLSFRNIRKGEKSNYSYFPVVVDEEKFGATRNDIFKALKKEGIGTRKYFYPLTNSLDCFPWKYNTEDTPVAKYVSDRVLCLPIYADLSEEDVDRVCEVVRNMKKAVLT